MQVNGRGIISMWCCTREVSQKSLSLAVKMSWNESSSAVALPVELALSVPIVMLLCYAIRAGLGNVSVLMCSHIFFLMAVHTPVTDVNYMLVVCQPTGAALLVPGSTPEWIRVIVDPMSIRAQQDVSTIR